MNLFAGIGRIGRDAETRYTNTGKEVTGWPLAIDVGYGDNKSTLWLDCSLWGERGSRLAGYIRKGERIGVQGEISLDTYQANDGTEKSKVRLRVADVTLLRNKQDGFETAGAGHTSRQTSQQPRPTPDRPQERQQVPAGSFDDDDIPF